MRKAFTALFVFSLFLLLGVNAHAATVTVTSNGADSYDDAIVVNWQASDERAIENVELRIENEGVRYADYSELSHSDTDIFHSPLSIVNSQENGVVIVKRTYEVVRDVDPQSLVQSFEQDGYSFSAREILYRELPGQTIAMFASKAAITVTDSDDAEQIMRQFPATIGYEAGGFSGLLHLDTSTLSTRPDRPETYTYTFTRTREVPGLSRNDPAYLDREWEGMRLTNVSFARGSDGRYTATAIYTGTATGRREVQYITTATYRGEITRELPGNIRFTVVYVGEPIELRIENEECRMSESPAAMIEIEYEDNYYDSSAKRTHSFLILNFQFFTTLISVSVTVITLLTTRKIRKERKQNREAIEEIQRFIYGEG